MLFKNLGPKHCLTEKNHYLCTCTFIKYYDNAYGEMQALWAWDGHNVVKSY